MKTYDEMFQSVLARRDEYEKQKRKKRIFLLRTSAVGLGAAAVIGLGVFTGIMKPPKRPSPEQSDIIKVTETTAVTETVSETAETQTKKPVQTTTAASTKESNINTSTQTTVSTSVKTETSRSSDSETVTSKTSPRSSTTPAVTSARSSASTRLTSASAARSTSKTRQTTTVKTTARTTATLTSAVTVTTRTTATQNAETTKNADTTKGAMGTSTWTMAAETMASETMTTTTKKANDSPKYPISTAYSYDFMISLCFAGITVDDVKYEKTLGDQEADSLGEYITNITLVPTMFTDYLPAEINAQVYAIKDISPKCEIAVKFDGLDYYKTYYTVMFERQTLGELIDNLGLEKNMDVKRAVINSQKYQIETDRFIELLLSASDAEAAASNENIGNDYIGYVIIELPNIIKSIRFVMTDKGYLHSTILTENGSLNYYIGEDKINEFLDYIRSCPTT